MPRVDDHVVPRRHVAARAARALSAFPVEVVLPRGVGLGCVAAPAHGVARRAQRHRVRVVAVRARDALRVHEALEERAVLVDLLLDLPVRVVERLAEERRPVGVHEWGAGDVPLRNHGTPRVAARARFDLRPVCARSGPACDRLARVDHPLSPVARLPHREDAVPLRCRVRAALLHGLGPRDVRRARAVAGLARDIDLGERRRVRVRGGVIALLHVRRVAVGAHEVPVLVRAGPVEDVVVRHVLVRVEMEPALAALGPRPRVPDDVQRLHAPLRKADQILLEGVDAERPGDLVVVERSVGAVRPHEVLPVLLREGRRDAVVRERSVREVPETVPGAGSAIACAWCDVRQRRFCERWQEAQAVRPTYVAAVAGSGEEAARGGAGFFAHAAASTAAARATASAVTRAATGRVRTAARNPTIRRHSPGSERKGPHPFGCGPEVTEPSSRGVSRVRGAAPRASRAPCRC